MGYDGFKYSPTHHYNYPYWRKDSSLKHWSHLKCYNGRFDYNVYINQIKAFIDRMNLKENQNKGFVSVNMLGGTTHGQFEFPRGFDDELKSYLEESDKKGHFSNTALMILSDHGGRPYAYGQKIFDDFAGLEYPFPFLSIRLPKSMRNSEFSKNFFNNKDRMLTSFDIRKTIKQLYYIAKNGVKQNEENGKCRKLFKNSNKKVSELRGISLFENIPQNRTCLDSLIPLNFCPCKIRKEIDHNQFFEQTGLEIQKAIDYFIDKLFDKTKNFRSICTKFEFKSIFGDQISYQIRQNLFFFGT